MYKAVLPDTVFKLPIRFFTWVFVRYYYYQKALWTQMSLIVHHSNLFAYPLTTLLCTVELTAVVEGFRNIHD